MVLEYVTLVLIPVVLAVTSITSYIMGYGRKTIALLLAVYSFILAWMILLSFKVYMGFSTLALKDEFTIDGMATFFALMNSLIFWCILLYSIPYMEHYVRKYNIPLARLSTYYSLLTVTFLTLYLMSFTNNSFLMWVFVEATTLATVILVGYGRYEASLEAAWKYILLCVIGLSTALYGTSLIYSYIYHLTRDAYAGLLFNRIGMHIQVISRRVSVLGLLFIVLGYGVKAGLMPFHFWLPDAYSEAPSPISAMLSSVVTGCGFYAIMRWFSIVPIRLLEPLKPILIALGLGSIFLGSFSIIKQIDLKRILAYSSIENMGIMLLGAAYPRVGFLFGLLHLFAHSIIKASNFLTVGILEFRYGKRSGITGVMAENSFLGTLTLTSVLSLEGMPPSITFLSLIGVAFAIRNLSVLILYIIGVLVGFIALIHIFIKTSWGKPSKHIASGKIPRLLIVATLILLIVAFITGIFVKPLIKLLGGVM